MLKGYSSTVQNAVAILRNLAAMKGIKQKWIEWLLILLGVVLGVTFNNRGLIGWLPIVANLEYSTAMFCLKENARGLKIAFVLNSIMFCVFNVFILNYVGAAANLVVSIVTFAAFLSTSRTTKK